MGTVVSNRIREVEREVRRNKGSRPGKKKRIRRMCEDER